jgi:hypothetical protein
VVGVSTWDRVRLGMGEWMVMMEPGCEGRGDGGVGGRRTVNVQWVGLGRRVG